MSDDSRDFWNQDKYKLGKIFYSNIVVRPGLRNLRGPEILRVMRGYATLEQLTFDNSCCDERREAATGFSFRSVLVQCRPAFIVYSMILSD